MSHDVRPQHTDPISRLVWVFLNSNLSIILILLSLILGAAALWITPREEDPQIVVPLADIFVSYPGHNASEIEKRISTPLERMLYQIDGVEYVYSMSRDDAAIITVRFYVGQDRERSLVKLFKKLNENQDLIPSGVAGWIMKPVEIDDVPIVTMSLRGTESDKLSDGYALRRVGEEIVERLATIPNVSRAYVIGGEPRTITVSLDPDRLSAYQMSPAEITRAVSLSNASSTSMPYSRDDHEMRIKVDPRLGSRAEIEKLVVGVYDGRPVFLNDVAIVVDGPDEVSNYVRHGWGSASQFEIHPSSPGWKIGSALRDSQTEKSSEKDLSSNDSSVPAVTIAISKQKGANAVWVAESVMREADRLKREVVPDDIEMIVTRNSGLVANEKVNELIEALGVAIIIVVLLLTFGLGWREAIIVSVAVPVVFGLTLAVNLLFGYTINRVTLFALILALGLLVDDPIVDVENIARHFEHRKKRTREIVLDAVSEIRPPLISATLAVIVSFLPMFFITGMMGPYMSPMALNVPVAMLMSMLVAFTITPWLSYHVLRWGTKKSSTGSSDPDDESVAASSEPSHHEAYDVENVKQSLLYKVFRPLMLPLLRTRMSAILFLVAIAGLTAAAMSLGAMRMVPLKMLPFDNKNEILFLLNMNEGTTLERTDAVVREMESIIASQPETISYVSTVGTAGPIDFNGMVRHYYLRNGAHQAEVRAHFVGKKNRTAQSHRISLRLRDELDALALKVKGRIQIVELPPGPPVLASLVAEVYADDSTPYDELLANASIVADRMRKEPGVLEVEEIRETPVEQWVFVPDQEKAAIAGISVSDIASTVQIALHGDRNQLVRAEDERNPLRLTFRLPRDVRSSPESLGQIGLKGNDGQLVLLNEIGSWKKEVAGQTIYHKNLKPIAYVMAESVGRPPADCVIDILSDQLPPGKGMVENKPSTPVSERTFFKNGSGIGWRLPENVSVSFAGEGEWKITLDVFRDLGLAFAAAMLMIYIILVAQTGSFLVPIIVMLAIPLTALGVMPGFYVLSSVMSQPVGDYADPVYFTATAMIGMIALSGIVTRDAIILVDFMQQSVARGRPLFDAILESRVVRLRPILLTAGAALLSALPITLDPIFSGLGWSLIFGLVASTLFTLFVIPVTYWLFSKGWEQTSTH
ncbi:MAG: efflux RND transporter permease subunit [Pirellula sp.]|nr:efflux RND transporter permease subunit [Pirellula sp.]